MKRREKKQHQLKEMVKNIRREYQNGRGKSTIKAYTLVQAKTFVPYLMHAMSVCSCMFVIVYSYAHTSMFRLFVLIVKRREEKQVNKLINQLEHFGT